MLNKAKKLKSLTTIPDKAQVLSYEIAQMLAKKKKLHLVAESIILPALTIAADIMLGSKAAEKFKRIPLSHQTMSSRIHYMGCTRKSEPLFVKDFLGDD